MKVISFEPGALVAYQEKAYRIRRAIDLETLLCERQSDGRLETIPIKFLSLVPAPEAPPVKEVNILDLEEPQWEVARKRYQIIEPLLENRGDGKKVQEIAKANSVSKLTLYRWIRKFDSTGKVSALLEERGKPLKGKMLLNDAVEKIIQEGIKKVYHTQQRSKVKNTCDHIRSECKFKGLPVPHPNTIRNRISQISDQLHVRKRYGSKIAEDMYKPLEGHYADAKYPFSVVQIDHTPLDLILVDEDERLPVGRAYLTLAIDVYSRMVLGFYISFDPPSALSVGLCLAHAILPKEKWLIEVDVDGSWPCWGVMKKIRADNAMEFRGNTLRRICQEYGMDLEWNKVATPKWNGHVERLMGTIANEIHELAGTTFSNTKQRGNYKSEQKAAFALKEFEQWFTTFIVQKYHMRHHKGINTTPLNRFRTGLIGDKQTPGTGLQPKILDEVRLKLDFMPHVERTIQEYGVLIDYIHYQSDVLTRWINAIDQGSGKARTKRSFVFKRDPRDLSMIYFYDPEVCEYFPVPYRDLTRPPMTIWEHRQAVKKLQEAGQKDISEDSLFEAHRKLKEIEQAAIAKTNAAKLLRARGRNVNTDRIALNKTSESPVAAEIADDAQLSSSITPGKTSSVEITPFDQAFDLTDIRPFEITHGTFK